jgi:hypothetical protein
MTLYTCIVFLKNGTGKKYNNVTNVESLRTWARDTYKEKFSHINVYFKNSRVFYEQIR